MDLESLLRQVKDAIFRDPTTPHREGHDPSGLIGQIEGLFGGLMGGRETPQRDVLPASQDPLGDPADLEPAQGYGTPVGYGQPQMPAVQQQYPNVRPASEDPLGDPADSEQFPNLKPATEDPLGDPADQEPSTRRW